MAKIGERSQRNLDSVHPVLGDVVAAALQQAPAWLDFAVICGKRSSVEQQALWYKGRDYAGAVLKREEVVTYRDGINKKSNHQVQADGHAYAIDIVAYERGLMTWDERENAARAGYIIGFAAAQGIKLTGGVKWDWDLGHIEIELVVK